MHSTPPILPNYNFAPPSDDRSIQDRGDGGEILPSFGRSWSGDGNARDSRMERASPSTLASAAVQSGWLTDDLGSSYRSWSSRGIAASDRFEQQVHQEDQVIDVAEQSKVSSSQNSLRSASRSQIHFEELSKVSSSQNSWRSDSPSQFHELNNDTLSKRSHDSTRIMVHPHEVGIGSGNDKIASSGHGSAIDEASLGRCIKNEEVLHSTPPIRAHSNFAPPSDDGSIGDRGDGRESLHSFGRSWSGDGIARDSKMDRAGHSNLASAAVQSGWLADDMGSSYRSWSSRGIAASDRFEQQIHEERQVIDVVERSKVSSSENSLRSDSRSQIHVEELSKVSSSQNSWRSDSPSQFHELNSDTLSKLSYDSTRIMVHPHQSGSESGDDKIASSAHGSSIDDASLVRCIKNEEVLHSTPPIRAHSNFAPPSDDGSLGERSDGRESLHSFGRSWSGDGNARDSRMDRAGQSNLASAAVQSGWLADDMGSSYRSWSSRGIAASDRF